MWIMHIQSLLHARCTTHHVCQFVRTKYTTHTYPCMKWFEYTKTAKLYKQISTFFIMWNNKFCQHKKKIEIKGTATTKFTRHVLFHLTDVNHIECYEHRNEIGQDRQTDKSPVFLYTECNILFFSFTRSGRTHCFTHVSYLLLACSR